MSDKAIELCRKLKALADKGVDGEKINAMAALEKLMKKHNLTFEDIEGEKKEYAHFRVSTRQEEIFYQILSSVIGDGYQVYKHRNKKGYKMIEMTASQAIEVHAKYDFYWRLYKEELGIFREAFISRNDIYHPNGRCLKQSEMTKEQVARMERVQEMAESIKEANFRKQLNH